MPWKTINSEEVLSELLPDERTALENLQLPDVFPAILTRVVNAARGCIVAGGGQVDQDGTIPDQLRDDIIALALWKWLLKFPELKSLANENRNNAASEAQKRLDKVASGDLKVEKPSAPIQQSAPVHGVTLIRPGRTTSQASVDLTATT